LCYQLIKKNPPGSTSYTFERRKQKIQIALFFRVLEHCGIIKQARLNTIFFEASEEKIIYFFAKINKDLPGYFLESSHFGYFLK